MKSSKKYTDVHTRQAIVQLYTKSNLTQREIAENLEIAPSTVYYWITRYEHARPPEPTPEQKSDEQKSKNPSRSTDGPIFLENKPKSGRRRKLDSETDREIFKFSSENPFASATDIRRTLDLSESVTAQTIRNRLRERGLRSRVPSKKDHLSSEHRQMRKAFALNHLEWTADRWNSVLFSDEKIFCIGGNGYARVWRPVLGRNERSLHPQYVSETRNTEWGRATIPVWGCISGGGRDRNHIHLIDPPDVVTTRPDGSTTRKKKKKTLDARYYVDFILGPIVKGIAMESDEGGELIFMHDRSPIHTAISTGDWLRENRVDTLFDWPPKGPDMNPIENVWAEIERRLRGRSCRDGHELWLHVEQTFRDLTADPEDPTLPSEYVKKLVESMPRRLECVYRRDGSWTEY